MSGRRERGQSLAELALLLPALLLILMGCLDLGRAFAVWVALANGTREGARYAALYPEKRADAAALAAQYVVGEGWSPTSLTVEVSATAAPGEPMAVTASYRLPLTTMVLFGGQPILITARTQMQALEGGPPE